MATKVTFHSFQAKYTDNTFDPTGNPVYADKTGPLYTWSDTKSGVSVPSFRKKLQDQQDATSSYSVVSESRSVESGEGSLTFTQSFFGKPKEVTHELKGQYAPINSATNPPGADSSRTINDATIAFLLKARQVQTKFRGLTFAGELTEALHGILRPASALRSVIGQSLVRLEKGTRYKHKKDRVKFVRATWLETQFHWIPLISDAQDAARALSEQVNKFRKETEVVRYTTEQVFPYGTTSQNDTYSVGGIYWRLVSQSKQTVSVSCTGAVGVTQFSSLGGFDPELWGFSPREFIPTLWELLPWSWAIDYFSNVGQVLDCYSFGLANLRWSSRTVKIKNENVTTLTYNSDVNSHVTGYIRGSGSSSRSVHTKFTLSRGRIDSLPSFSFDISVPGWRQVVNLASALSLNKRVVSKLTSF